MQSFGAPCWLCKGSISANTETCVLMVLVSDFLQVAVTLLQCIMPYSKGGPHFHVNINILSFIIAG
jgi:hypothetical protein